MSQTEKRPRSLRARRVSRATRRPARPTISHTGARLETLTVNPRDRHHTEASGRRYALLYHRRRLTNAAALGLGDGLALVAAMLLAGATRWWLIGEPMIRLIVGTAYVAAADLLVLLAGAYAVLLFGFALEPVFFALGRPGVMLRLNAIAVALKIVLTFLLVAEYGLIGAGMAILASEVIGVGLTAIIALDKLSKETHHG
ncbi:MAG: polysaccharide biosynthesis C-terminal domain-containing protein [Bacteroidetes bacterium]|nr:polysaccharide biosynthesis C-terminal domain-containing protein [Bacteroidota bacterium]